MTFDERYFDIGRLDRLSYKDTCVHRLDPRAKVIATVMFLFTVISFPKYEVVALAPFFLFPVLLMTVGEIPILFIVKKMIIVSPFAIFIGIFNPFLDTRTAVVIAGIPVSAGWLSFLSILLKFALTISAALLLIATTSFPAVCHALRRLGFPALFVSQLLFLYRYLFVLMEEAMRIIRAREMRSFGRRSTGMKVFARLIGTLFLRTVDRADRIYYAMLSRGFQGDVPTLKRSRIAAADLAFMAATVAFLAVFRSFRVTEEIGRIAQELFL
ncbi:MAG: cobalt ECF transporter T component CbiQ [Proteobacteria bacterium]|nr:cobalt ECF transporter T component CbiQ [Pseudomonadota bacterium]MBU2260596.1 cobalt ECF transporter T component CbiQ [Pseudomonadota bacterium]